MAKSRWIEKKQKGKNEKSKADQYSYVKEGQTGKVKISFGGRINDGQLAQKDGG